MVLLLIVGIFFDTFHSFFIISLGSDIFISSYLSCFVISFRQKMNIFLCEVVCLLLRPLDDSGDILPVSSLSALLSGPEAVTALVRLRLNLLAGEWWENPARGCEIFNMIRDRRITEQDAPSLSSYLCSYISATPGVRSLEDVRSAVTGRQFTFSCRVLTEDGSWEVSYSVDL